MILVTGATGKSGREIVRQLRGAGARVRALVRDRAKAEDLSALAGVELAVGDLGEPATLDAALDGADAALLLSAPEPRSVELQTNFIEAARRASTPRLVKFSALGADPDAPEGFYKWHGQIERVLRESGLAHTNLRPTVFMQEILNSWGRQSVIRLPLDGARVAAVDIRDIAAVAVKTLTEDGHEGRSYAITGPESLTFHEIAARISDATGGAVTYESISSEQFGAALGGSGLPAWLVSALVTLYEDLRAGGGSETSDTVERVAGRRPVSFGEFAREHAAAFRAS